MRGSECERLAITTPTVCRLQTHNDSTWCHHHHRFIQSYLPVSQSYLPVSQSYLPVSQSYLPVSQSYLPVSPRLLQPVSPRWLLGCQELTTA
jgi:hypothetical protein